jgi:diketogulonate reductase-like aldo/keto reductase
MTAIPTTPLADGSAIPVYGMGTWNMGESRSRFDGEVAALRRGLDLGISLIDTAEMYGNGGAERVVAEAISGRRDATYLVSKVLPSNASRHRTIRACEDSLARLGTDRLDLYLLHWRSGTPLEETVRAFEDLRAAGKILRWGVSNFDLDDMAELAGISGDCAVNQVLYNLSRRGIEYDLLPWQRARSIPVMAYSPIEQGQLSDEGTLEEIAEAHGATATQVALAWLLEKPGVMAIPKTSSFTRMEENLRALALRLTDADRAALDETFPPPRRRQPLEMI